MEIIKKLIKVGVASLMIVIPKDVTKKLNLKEGDFIKAKLEKIK